MTPEEEIKRAGRAREILENKLFKEAVLDIEEALKQARLNSGATDIALRERLASQELGLYAIVQKLKTHMETGVLAEEEIRRKSISEKVKEWIGA